MLDKTTTLRHVRHILNYLKDVTLFYESSTKGYGADPVKNCEIALFWHLNATNQMLTSKLDCEPFSTAILPAANRTVLKHKFIIFIIHFPFPPFNLHRRTRA